MQVRDPLLIQVTRATSQSHQAHASSRLQCMAPPVQVAACVLPNVAVVVYDWRVYTLQELLRSTRKVLSNNKVLSIAVIAPGSKPGCVGACPRLNRLHASWGSVK